MLILINPLTALYAARCENKESELSDSTNKVFALAQALDCLFFNQSKIGNLFKVVTLNGWRSLYIYTTVKPPT